MRIFSLLLNDKTHKASLHIQCHEHGFNQQRSFFLSILIMMEKVHRKHSLDPSRYKMGPQRLGWPEDGDLINDVALQ